MHTNRKIISGMVSKCYSDICKLHVSQGTFCDIHEQSAREATPPYSITELHTEQSLNIVPNSN